MSELIAGIDLGTTNSELAVILDDELQVVPIHGDPIMPSCVGLDPAGKLLVGRPARNQLLASPESTVVSVKRQMGESTRVRLGSREFSPEEISSFILLELKKQAERQLGRTIRKAVVTVPAFFNESQRKATQVAGELAGLEVVRILNEPTAAALAYGAGSTAGKTLLVYDLGGGTFDVSVVVVEAGVVEVKASHGDTKLGGDDFDRLLVDRTVREFEKAHKVDLRADTRVLRRLQVVMERAKRALSDEPYVHVREEYLDGRNHLEFEIVRHVYESMISPLLEKTLTCLHESLRDARLTPRDISKVMLVGGATRTPLVHRLLQERIGLEARFEINPDLVVAMGAAVQAGILTGGRRHLVLVDITPHTLSTAALTSRNGMPELICVPIILRNSPLPASKSEMFATISDEQPSVEVSAYQGEGEFPEENTLVGKFLIEGLAPVPAGNHVVLHFDLDLNGMLKVTATEKSTGLSKSAVMDTRGKNVVDIENARRNIAALAGEVSAGSDEEEDPEAPVATARDLRKRAEALLGTNISPDDAAEIRRLVHDSAQAVAARDWVRLGELCDTLSDLLFYLED